MLVRYFLAAAGAAGLAALPSDPLRYRLEQRVETVVDLSAFGQGEQVQQQAQAWYFTVTYTDSAGGTVLHAVLDSLQADGGMFPVPQASLDSAAGTVYHGYLDARRKLQSVTSSKASTFGAQFEAMLRGFHPVVNPGARPGQGWTDTLEVDLTTAQLTSRTRSVRAYQMGGEEPRDGVPARRLDMTFTESQTGTMQTPSGAAELAGTSRGNGSYFLSPTGQYLGGSSRSEGEATVTGAFAPSAIPLRLTTTTTITLLK